MDSINKKYKTRKIVISDEEYPKKLLNIKNPPKELYVIGKLPDFSNKIVSIVGARNCSEYGSTIAKSIAKIFSKNNVQVISGLALGIDTCGHIGALEEETPTFAVLGCGANVCYPTYNYNIYEKIIENGGGIISELPDNTPPLPYNFPLRNRIISGLSDVIIVVEAKSSSGSLITADFALEQGKDIFAIPGRVGDILSVGTNNLIKQGAYILTSADDVLEHLGLIVDGFIPKKESDIEKLDYFERLVYDILNEKTLHIDQIVEKAKLPINKCLNVLISLELYGLVKSAMNNYYSRVE